MADEISAAEVSRRVDRLEKAFADAFSALKDELASWRVEQRSQPYVHQLQYDADKRAMQDDIHGLTQRHAEDIADLRASYKGTISRMWWVAGTLAALALSVVGLFLR